MQERHRGADKQANGRRGYLPLEGGQRPGLGHRSLSGPHITLGDL